MIIFDYVSLFLGTIFIVWSGYLFFRKFNKEVLYFSYFTLFAGLWMLSVSATNNAYTESQVYLLTKLDILFGVCLMFFFLIFVIVFRDSSKNILKENKFVLPIIVIFILSVFLFPNNKVIEGVKIYYNKPAGGKLTVFFAYFFTLLVLYILIKSVYVLFRKYRKLDKRKKYQIKYVSLGASIAIVSGILFDVILPWILRDERFYSLGPVSFIFFIGFTNYAIIRHQLLDIKIVIQKSLIYSASLAVIVAFYLLLIFILGFFFGNADVRMAGSLITILVGIYGVPFIERYFRKKTDKIFFRDKYDYSEALYKLSEVLNQNINMEILIDESMRVLKEIIKIGDTAMILPEKNVIYKHGKFGGYRDIIDIDFRRINSNRNFPVLSISEFMAMKKDGKLSDEETVDKIIGFGVKYGGEIVIPFILRGKLIGIVILGEKLSGDFYSHEDVNLLKTFSHQAAVALEKSHLYEKAKDYSRELESRVKKRTSRIKGMQEEQRQMMLEIAHGLQTPITIIKGELSEMKKESNNPEKLDSLERSLDRISKFIYSMLKLSRLDSGEKGKDFKEFNMSDLLEEIIESIRIITEEKGIEVVADIEPGINFIGERGEIEEILMNLFSNSVKYMDEDREKKISVVLERKEGKISLAIEDTGIGIAGEHIPNLFSKFYRIKDSKIKGTGLGLVICKKIVEKHGGKIKLDSESGKGTKISIIFNTKKKISDNSETQ